MEDTRESLTAEIKELKTSQAKIKKCCNQVASPTVAMTMRKDESEK